MSRNSRGRENPFCTLKRVVKRAKDEGRVNSGECTDICTAVSEIDCKIGELQTENGLLRKKNEQLSVQVEKADEFIRARDQTEVARASVVKELIAEGEKCKANCMKLTSPSPSAQVQTTVEDTHNQKFDPFVALLGTYIHNQEKRCESGEKQTKTSTLQQLDDDRKQSSGHQQSVDPSCHEREGNRASIAAGKKYQIEDSDTKKLLEDCTNTVHSRRKRTYSDVNQVMFNAGMTAQSRRRSVNRYQRSLSLSSVPLRRNSQRNSLVGFDDFMSVFNDNTVSNGELSKLSWLILRVLSEARRPVEVATLKQLLTNSTTSSQTECFLRYSVVRYLVAQLQSSNSGSVMVNVCPFLVESSSQFIEDLNQQHPVNKRRYTTSF